jgi:single stranded DNA-binding protein
LNQGRCHERLRQQGDFARQSRPRPGGAADAVGRSGGQSAHRHEQSWRDKATGERRERTEWHSVVIFNPALGRVAEQFLKKGSKVYVAGRLRRRTWQDEAGGERTTTEIVLGGPDCELTLLPDGRRGGFGEGAAAAAAGRSDQS